ncbi:MAG: extracellular solute-binding protein [Chlorobi bacterium]|nr:extracellular solute-binding protein [Chlorobiota bacterium]
MIRLKHLSALVWLLLFFLGCGDDRPSLPVLRVWHFWSAPHHRQVLDTLVRRFEQAHHCRVELTPLSWGEGKTKLMAAFNSRTAPDVLELGSDWVAQFSSSGVLAELSASEVDTAVWLPWSLPPCRWNGHYYAIPWIVDTRVLFVNTALVAAARTALPRTLDELLDASAAIQERTDAAGFGATGADEHRLYKKILPLMWTLGGDVFDSTGRCTLASSANIRALELYAQLSRTGIIDTQKQLDAAFVRGQVAFWNSGSWLIEKIEHENSTLAYTAIIFPGRDAKTPGVSFAGGEYWAVSKSTSQRDLAVSFIRFMSAPEQTTYFCKRIAEAGFPANAHVFTDSSIAHHPVKRVFARQLLHAQMTPVHPRWLDIERILESAVVDVLYGRSNAATALKTAQLKIDDLLGKDGSR